MRYTSAHQNCQVASGRASRGEIRPDSVKETGKVSFKSRAFDVRPLLVIWEMTQACDLKCMHCRASAQPHRHALELSTAEAFNLVDQEAVTSLPRKNADFLGEYDWLAALEKRGVVVAARTLLGFICEGAYATKPGGVDAWTLYRKLAAAMRMDSGFRAEVYQRYERDTCGAGCEILEMAIAEAADEAGVLLLVRNYARGGKPFPGALRTAIRHVAVGQRPSEDWVGATVSFSVDVIRLRRELFRMISGETPEASLAKECLNAIDELRDEYGAPESEPRHPDIESGQPWPIVR